MKLFRSGTTTENHGDKSFVAIKSCREVLLSVCAINKATIPIAGPSTLVEKGAHLRTVAPRCTDSDQIVLQRFSAVLAANPFMQTKELMRNVIRIVEENSSTRSRVGHLQILADKCVDALAPYVACRSGCTHCCHFPVAICTAEAKALARKSGRTMSSVPVRPLNNVHAAISVGRQSPCPFLVDGRCGVYEVRPMSCRLHHSLDETPMQCDVNLPPEQSRVPKLGLRPIEIGYLSLMLDQEWGDIREFFPDN